MKLGMATYHPRLRPIRRFLNKSRFKGKNGVLAVDIHANNIGFFAQLNWCLYVLACCENRKLAPRLRLTGPLYGDVPNHDWFHDFFEDADVIKAPAEPADSQFLRIMHIQETDLASVYGPPMTIEEAHRLFTTHFHIKENIQSYVDRFVAQEFTATGAFGLHFRGTDKKIEAEPVDWPRSFRSIMKLAEDWPAVKRVFISSDDPKFIDWFAREAQGSLSVVVHPDEERSKDGKPVHTTTGGNHYQKGFEALVNCLLLSRCTALIRSASFLSGWSSIFNPQLPMTLLNEPYGHTLWFPDRELVKRSNNRYRAT